MNNKKDEVDLEKVTGGKLDFDLNHDIKDVGLSSDIVCQHKFDSFNCGGCPNCKITITPGSNIHEYSCLQNYFSGLLFDTTSGKIIN